MEIFKKYNTRLTPTCVKETMERKHESRIKQNEERQDATDDTERRQDSTDNSLQDDMSDSRMVPPSLTDLVFASTQPYPELEDVIPNRGDVRQLKAFATGKNSELSAILTYLYQEYIFNEEYPIIGKALEKISVVEMTHYELLADAIVAFGGDPNLTDGQGNVWTGRNVVTIKNITRALQDDITAERGAIKDYTKAARETSNRSLSELYLRIAEDEKIHIKVLEELLEMV